MSKDVGPVFFKNIVSKQATIPVLVHLSGSRRGTTEKLSGQTVRLGTAANAEIHFPADREPPVSAHHATLQWQGHTYELRAQPQREISVNGKAVDAHRLTSGDVLQIGRGGPLLRFRLLKGSVPAYKSMREALADCVDCARYGGSTPIQRAGIFLSNAPRELLTQTSPRLRGAMATLMLLVIASMVALILHTVRLERQLQAEQLRLSGIAQLLQRGDSGQLTLADLDTLRGQIENRLSSTNQRLGVLEARLGAGRHVIAAAARSIVFLQGAYGFVQTDSGKALRYVRIGPDGSAAQNSRGEPLVTTEGDGPVVESLFSGTAFVVSDDGLLLTNRHVARPWEFDETAQAVAKEGFTPVLGRFVGYLPGMKEAFNVQAVLVSGRADLAVLRGSGVTGQVKPLRLSGTLAEPGDEVIVMGYPTGIRALLARADKAFVDELRSEAGLDFWAVARRLSLAGRIAPLATRGIIGQISSAAVVYDADTTNGGSGGPVLDLDGDVIAINTGVMPGFGGSNLGIPASQARMLLADVRARTP